jgi:hypothetical protein
MGNAMGGDWKPVQELGGRVPPDSQTGSGAIYFFPGTTASLQALATRNFTTVFAGILIAAPV